MESCGDALCSPAKVCQGTARACHFLGTSHVSGMPGDRDEPKWWKVGPQVACDWGGGDRPCSSVTRQWHGFLSHGQHAGISRGQHGLIVPPEPGTSLGGLGEREPSETESEPDTEEFECPRTDWRDCNLPDGVGAQERGKERET